MKVDNLCGLEVAFGFAKDNNVKAIGVEIEVGESKDSEVIVFPSNNFDSKLDYYKKAYNEDLTLKSKSDIRIVGIQFVDHIAVLELDSNGYLIAKEESNLKSKKYFFKLLGSTEPDGEITDEASIYSAYAVEDVVELPPTENVRLGVAKYFDVDPSYVVEVTEEEYIMNTEDRK